MRGMKTMMMAALAVAALLAGCSSSSDDASTDSSDLQDVAAWNSAVTYTSCIEQDVSFPIPMADASAGLPEGFAPVAFDEQGQTSMVLIWTDRCFSGELAGEDVASPGEMWGFLPVVPPAAFLDDSVQGYLLAYGAMVSDPAVAAMYHAWGLSEQNVTVGNVSIGT
ncbi:MAG TPA: hypothetical protein VI796_05810, partial [Candidatus Thermoplasmatota archaeon]|nr:hypothetical protein [Candidatus Thermoplasmatota archaeon]